ncbi:hypothetical protein, conserved [Eimeria maxima]|uniref:Deubiquitinating enzyme MINDY-3/4 conserved domain-containing protein n=1 Tax=Eimeria maxima TaxID=5804 RepID=U6M2G6_EIMMA|nr:hypothetical protein, conserved [Eimeria maxima]CDJ57263.1 hypothetical protein, conserved [Eimeria maxima]
MPPKEFVRPRATSPEVLRLVEAAGEMDRQQLQQQQEHQQALQQQQQQQQQREQQQNDFDVDDVELQRALEASLRESTAPSDSLPAAAAPAAAAPPPAPRQLSAAEFMALLPEDDDLTDLLQPPPPRSSSSSTFPLSRSSNNSSSNKLPEDRFRVPQEWIDEEERRGCCCCCRPFSSSSSRRRNSVSADGSAATGAPQQQQERFKCCSCVTSTVGDAAAAAPAADVLTEEEQRASFEASTLPLQQQQRRELLLLLFGEGNDREIDKEDLARWLAHPIAFAADCPEAMRGVPGGVDGAAGGAAAGAAATAAASCEDWGLVQVHGGPCGVLAALQCFVLRSLLFSRFRAAKRLQHQQQQQQQQPLRLHPCLLQRQHALAEAVAAVLYQCTDSSVYKVAALLPSPQQQQQQQHYNLPKGSAASAAAPAADVDSLQVYVREIIGIKEVMRFYFLHFNVLLYSPGAALSLLASVVLTRGPQRVRADMDPPSRALVGVYGHCMQEALNLLLQGAASSNVCDGAAMIGEASLGGVYKRPVVGFLSEMEVLR